MQYLNEALAEAVGSVLLGVGGEADQVEVPAVPHLRFRLFCADPDPNHI